LMARQYIIRHKALHDQVQSGQKFTIGAWSVYCRS
jgi:hypothetical protein